MKSFHLLVLLSVLSVSVSAEYIGYYSWNWGKGSQGPPGRNIGVAFTGYTDVDQAIRQYDTSRGWCCPELNGDHWISLGGGNWAGVFNDQHLQNIAQSAQKIKAAGYVGVMFDVEEVRGPHINIVPLFAQAFASLKQAGLKVGVTTSHSAPYQCDSAEDSVEFVKAWAADPNVDVISPQLYSSGHETAPQYDETNYCKAAGCKWELYKGGRAVFAPSIVSADQYEDVKTYFAKNYSIQTGGYFEWKQRARIGAEFRQPLADLLSSE